MKTVLIERLFAYAPEQVFDAWTDPALLLRWFAPQGCSIDFEHIDVRSGGGFRSTLQHPTLGGCRTVAEFLEVVRPERIVFNWRMAEGQAHDPEWPKETRVTVTFVAHAGGTLMKLAQSIDEDIARRTGAYPSWLQMLDRLDELLADGKESAHV